jgi:transcriptional regulator with XRE-family HTH domain
MMVRSVSTPRHGAMVAAIVAAREANGLTQEQVAQRLGKHQVWVARVESGERRIDVVEFLDLAHAIGFDPMPILQRIYKPGRRRKP